MNEDETGDATARDLHDLSPKIVYSLNILISFQENDSILIKSQPIYLDQNGNLNIKDLIE